ncbi:MAG TPA: hypothetical protein VF677_06165 [Flavobacterium sp.]|jgi:hypothetical protein
MHKIIDDIHILEDKYSLTLVNVKTGSFIRLNLKEKKIIFYDFAGNIIQNHPSTVRINSEVSYLTTVGQIININNGSRIAYLSTSDVQELAENTFYEQGQIRVYDFINLKFNCDLSYE